MQFATCPGSLADLTEEITLVRIDPAETEALGDQILNLGLDGYAFYV